MGEEGRPDGDRPTASSKEYKDHSNHGPLEEWLATMELRENSVDNPFPDVSSLPDARLPKLD